MADVLIPAHVPPEQIFYITFGIKWRREAHPNGMHPDGWAVIVAPNEHLARLKANKVFNYEWAFIYDHLDRENGRFHKAYHPAGALGVWYVTKEDM